MIEILGLAILCWMFAEGFEPIQVLKKSFCEFDLSDPTYWTGLLHWIIKAINCSLCTGFWVGLIYFENIFNAAIISVLAESISRLNKNTITL